MTDQERKIIARKILTDLHGDYFRELDYETLQDFYKCKCKCESVPNTLCCATDEARRIIGEPTASKLLEDALKRRRL